MTEDFLDRRLPRQPYPGIRPFHITNEEDESTIFHGRSDHTNALVDRLSGSHLVAVLGPSGSGKSSLVRVGLLPKLERGYVYQAGSRWVTTSMEPGKSPLRRLAEGVHAAVRKVYSLEGTPVETQLPEDEWSEESFLRLFDSRPDALVHFFAFSKFQSNTNILLVVDQFEELFRKDLSDEAESRKFINLLLNVFNDPPDRLYIVLTMRTDSLEECAQFRGLPEALNQTSYLIPRLNERQLRDAIEAPARDFGATVQEDLIEHLLAKASPADGTYDQDSMPLLQHSLLRLWLEVAKDKENKERAEKPPAVTELTLERYKEIGGFDGSLSAHADDLYESLDSREKVIADRMLRLMCFSSERDRYSRRMTTVGEIANVGGFDGDEIDSVVNKFADETVSFIRLKKDGEIDVTHESVIRKWRRFRSLADEEREASKAYLDLAERAQAKKRGEAGYLSGPVLSRFRDWWRERDPSREEVEIWKKRLPCEPDDAEIANFDETQNYLQISRLATYARRSTPVLLSVLLMFAVLGTLGIYSVDTQYRRLAGELWSLKAPNGPDMESRAQLGLAATHVARLADHDRIPSSTMEGLHKVAYSLTRTTSLIGRLKDAGWNLDTDGSGSAFYEGDPRVVELAIANGFVATGKINGEIRLWSIASGRHHRLLDTWGPRPHFQFGPANMFAFGTTQMTGIINTRDQDVPMSRSEASQDLAWRDDMAGSNSHPALLAVSRNGSVEIRNSRQGSSPPLRLSMGGERVQLSPNGRLGVVLHRDYVELLALSFQRVGRGEGMNGSGQASVSGQAERLEIESRRRFSETATYATFFPTAAATWLATADGRTVFLTEILGDNFEESPIRSKRVFSAKVVSIAIDAEGETLAVGLTDGQVLLSTVGEVMSDSVAPATRGCEHGFRPGSQVLYGAGFREEPVHDVAVAFGPDYLYIAGPTGELAQFRYKRGTCGKRKDFLYHSSSVVAAAYDPATEGLYTLAEDGDLILWSKDRGKRLDVMQGASPPAGVDPLIVYNGSLLFLDGSGTISFWPEPDSNQQPQRAEAVCGQSDGSAPSTGGRSNHPVYEVAFVPDARDETEPSTLALVSCRNGEVYEWDLAVKAEPVRVRDEDRDSRIGGFAFGVDSTTYLAIAAAKPEGSPALADQAEDPGPAVAPSLGSTLIARQIGVAGQAGERVIKPLIDKRVVSTSYMHNLIIAGEATGISFARAPDSLYDDVVIMDAEVSPSEWGQGLGDLTVADDHVFLRRGYGPLQYWRIDLDSDSGEYLGDLQSLPGQPGIVAVTEAPEKRIQTINYNGEIAYYALSPERLLKLFDSERGDQPLTSSCRIFEKYDNWFLPFRRLLTPNDDLVTAGWRDLGRFCQNHADIGLASSSTNTPRPESNR